MNHSVKIYKVKGMHCASCVGIIEKTFKKIEGVHSVEVNYGTEKAKVGFDESKTNAQELSNKIEPFGYSLALDQGNSQDNNQSTDEHAGHLGINQSK